MPYTCEATLIPRARPYISAYPPKRFLPPLIGARIESNSRYAQLDEASRYRLRHLFEPGVNPYAPVPTRKQSPHGGPRSPRGKPTGWHAPLQDGVEVLLSCINHDPEQLMIAAGTYRPGNKSPVLAENLTQNIYRSACGNALIMDDKQINKGVNKLPDQFIKRCVSAEKPFVFLITHQAQPENQSKAVVLR